MSSCFVREGGRGVGNLYTLSCIYIFMCELVIESSLTLFLDLCELQVNSKLVYGFCFGKVRSTVRRSISAGRWHYGVQGARRRTRLPLLAPISGYYRA